MSYLGKFHFGGSVVNVDYHPDADDHGATLHLSIRGAHVGTIQWRGYQPAKAAVLHVHRPDVLCVDSTAARDAVIGSALAVHINARAAAKRRHPSSRGGPRGVAEVPAPRPPMEVAA